MLFTFLTLISSEIKNQLEENQFPTMRFFIKGFDRLN